MTAEPTRCVALAIASSALFAVIAAAGACESEPGWCPGVAPASGPASCVDVRTSLDFGAQVLTHGAPGGYLLLSDYGERLTLVHLDPRDRAEEIASFEGVWSGAVLRDAQADRLWVLAGAELHELDRQGQVLATTELSPPDTVLSAGLLIREGELIRGVAAPPPDPLSPISLGLIERRSLAGELRWSVELDTLDTNNFEVDQIFNLDLRAGLLTGLAYDGLIDSSAIELLALDPETGAPRWRQRLSDDDYSGPVFAIAGDAEHIYLGRLEHAPYDPEGQFGAAQASVTALDGEGEIVWTRSHDLPELRFAEGIRMVRVSGGVVLLASGSTGIPGEFSTHRSLVRHAIGGTNSCSTALPEQGAWWPLVAIGGGRMALGGAQYDEPTATLILDAGTGGCVDLP